MKFRTLIIGLTLVFTMVLTAGCGSGQPSQKATKAEENTDKAPDEIETATLETIAELLGKSDLQASEVFGGGKENWTEDKTIYIGRVYQVNLFDEEVSVYTSYDENQLVNSISIWLVNGEGITTEEAVFQWVERLNEFTGAKPTFHDAASEGGSKNWKWFLGDRAFALNWMEDMLTISMNVVVGELEKNKDERISTFMRFQHLGNVGCEIRSISK